MSTFSVHFDTDNAAFTDDGYEGKAEILRILSAVSEKLRQGRESGSILDLNGNAVGQFDWVKQ